jgi:hypothetical protein
MSIKLGSTDISKVYLGSTEIQKVYKGSNLVYSSVFNPLSLEPLLWLDGSDENTITYDGSNLVSYWSDKSGNDNDFYQSTTGDKPLYDVSEQGIDFYGNDTAKLITDTVLITGTAAREIIAVVKRNIDALSGNIYETFFSINQKTKIDLGILWRVGTEVALRVNRYKVFNEGLEKNVDGIVNIYSDENSYVEDAVAYLNGTALGQLSLLNTLINTENNGYSVIGSDMYQSDVINNNFEGWVKELILFDRVLTTEERNNLTNYLNNKWTIY